MGNGKNSSVKNKASENKSGLHVLRRSSYGICSALSMHYGTLIARHHLPLIDNLSLA